MDHASVEPSNSKKVGNEEGRKRPESIAVDTHLLQTGPNSPMRAAPSERLPASPSTSRNSYESPARTPASPTKSSHARSMSVIDSAHRGNRLSMSFPVLPPSSRPSRPPSWANSPIVSPTDSTIPEESNILTQLAGQERKVLELRESLRQAEAELHRLKKHWATHEALKKRSDVRRIQQLQPLSLNLSSLETSEDDVDGSSQWLQKEMERRKQLLSGIKTSNRKVFSGSKHTRTLSLLSPEKGSFSQPFPQPADVNNSEPGTALSPTPQRVSGSFDINKSTSPSEDQIMAQLDGAVSRDDLIRTGRQMANDIKDGLWTFFEDIRQATVGDEAVYGSETSRQNNPRPLTRSNTTGSSKPRTSRPGRASTTNVARRDLRTDNLIDAGGSFWREHGVDTPTAKPAAKPSKRLSKKNASPYLEPNVDDEPWDNWETPVKQTPNPQYESSSDTSEGSRNLDDMGSDATGTPRTDDHSRPTPRTSTDRTSVAQSYTRSGENKRNSIPWPDLDKLTPSNLKRTASHLMKEWERSLTPSPSGELSPEAGTVTDTPLSSGGKSNKSD